MDGWVEGWIYMLEKDARLFSSFLMKLRQNITLSPHSLQEKISSRLVSKQSPGSWSETQVGKRCNAPHPCQGGFTSLKMGVREAFQRIYIHTYINVA